MANPADLKALADQLEMMLDTAVTLSEITLDNASSSGSEPGPYLDERRAAALMQLQVFLGKQIFNEFCTLMDKLKVPA